MIPLFIAATGQNVGKTTMSVGIVNYCIRRGLKVGFIKPVGQKYVQVGDITVDDDSLFMRDIFGMKDDLKAMSPVAIPRGFTTDYIQNRSKYAHLKDDILRAFETVSKDKDVVIIEGTGHSGVGAIFGLSNATVARMLNAKVIMVAEGGIGSAIDEIVLNAALIDKGGLEIIGVIINKVLEDKYEKIKEIVSKDLIYKNYKPMGFIPYRSFLTYPHISQIREKTKSEIICNGEHMNDYVENIVIAAMEPQNTIAYLTNRSLVITPGDRIDNILVAISTHLMGQDEDIHVAGILLTGGFMPHQSIITLLKKTNIPVMITKADTYNVASQVYSLTVKTQPSDGAKVEIIKDVFEKYADTTTLMQTLGL
ncbi:MAG: AAA family ATPase [Spirochaetes bacterium]|nr:AAA family ATPase [Spirochaetota bacterium]